MPIPPRSSITLSTISPDLLAAKKELTDRYLSAPRAGATGPVLFSAAVTPDPAQNVVGVGIGEKVAESGPTGTLAVKLFVRAKLPESLISASNLLPTEVGGLPTDVEEVGRIIPLARKQPTTRKKPKPASPPEATLPNPRTRQRPARPGCSIGFKKETGPDGRDLVMAGTLGAVVRERGGTVLVLSNNHVLADENRLPLGAAIYQPGLLDGGNTRRDQIAKLARFVALDSTGANSVDAAIARVLEERLVDPTVLYINAVPAGVIPAEHDMLVHKFGRTTSYTIGRVTALNADFHVGYETASFLFTDQVVIRGLDGRQFSDSGDSGSIILDRRTNNAVGLLFAGSPTHTLANPIQSVLDALEVTFAP